MEYSAYQKAIFDYLQHNKGNLIVEAVAGSGKSFTLEHSIRYLLQHSPTTRILAVMFNKHNQTSLSNKLEQYGDTVDVKTLHSIGYNMLMQSYGRLTLDTNKYYTLIENFIKQYKLPVTIIPELRKVIHFAQVTESYQLNEYTIQTLLNTYNIPIEHLSNKKLVSYCNAIMKVGLKHTQQGYIDFNDMIFAPNVLGLQYTYTPDIILIDEAQDLSNAQLGIALRIGSMNSRYVAFGDSKQAIQMFAGSMSNSMKIIQSKTNAHTLPLSICYRCPSSHLDLARKIVPYIENKPDCIEGSIEYITKSKAIDMFAEGDLIICRHNAPMIRLAIRAIKNNVAGVKVRGRDIGKDIMKHYKAIKKEYGNVNEETMQQYKSDMIAKYTDRGLSENSIAILKDTIECLASIQEHYDNVQQGIDTLFADTGTGIIFSSVHRAKGNEAERVFILEPELLDKDYADSNCEQVQQRKNVKYVALTRSKGTLVFVQ